MLKLLPILFGALFMAMMTGSDKKRGPMDRHQPMANRIAFFLLVVCLAMPVALREKYNDTVTYLRNFVYGNTFSELMASGSLHILKNPAFRIYSAVVRSFTDNYTIFFLFPAFFVQYSYMRFIYRHCPDFVVGVFLFFCLGTYTFAIAAMKQTIATAVALYAVDDLIERRHRGFYVKVFIAFLFHTYALVFLLLPLFTDKPWTFRTLLLLAGIYFFMANFDSVIESFLEIANESGKGVSGSEIIGTASINPIRVAVYAVAPLFALVFRRYLFYGPDDREHNILVNMSIISVSIMSLGLISAANMFARLAQYLEFGLICSLPWMIRKPFEKMSGRLIMFIALACFTAFFVYSQAFWIPFDNIYQKRTLMDFFQSLVDAYLYG